MIKEILSKEESRNKLKIGIEKLADAVGITMGPKGQNVIIRRGHNSPVVTKDGVTVAKSIFLKDNVEDMGAQMIKEAAAKTAENAGDGTTTATILTRTMINMGLKNIAAGANPMDVKRGIDKATSAIVKRIARLSTSVKSSSEKIEQVAVISANGDKEIGKIIAEAMSKVGNEGVITVEESASIRTYSEVLEGIQFDQGYMSPHFLNPEKAQIEMVNPLILLCEKKVNSMNEILHILEGVVKNEREILIIAVDIDEDALRTLVLNNARGNVKVTVVKTEGYGERRKAFLEDIAVLTNNVVVSNDTGRMFKNTTAEDLGGATKVIITKSQTTIVGGYGIDKEIKAKKEKIKKLISNSKVSYEKTHLRERLAGISGGVAVLYIGAATETEMKEKKDRVDDALHATKAATEEGIVPGGGTTYIRCTSSLSKLKGENADQNIGISIVRHALTVPLYQIVRNGNSSPDVIVEEVKISENIEFGYDARTEKFCNMIEQGIIDPAKVIRVALENASSISGMILTTGYAVSDLQQKKEE